MIERDRRLAIGVSLAFLSVGFAGWAASPAASNDGGPMIALWLAAALLAVLSWVHPSSREMVWVIPAMIGPLALYPISLRPETVPIVVIAVVWPLSAWPLGRSIADEAQVDRRRLAIAVHVAAGAALVLGVIPALDAQADPGWYTPLQFGAVVSIAAIPAFTRIAMGRAAPSTAQVTEQATLLAVAAAPALAGTILVSPWEIGAAALVVAITVAIVLAVRIVVRPLASIAARDSTERQLAVAASEAERTRLAADLHDGPLQDVLLLARRLDGAGDAEGAAMARGIGDELRDLSGDLRLPLLDDLGVGPALDWLVGRVRRMTAIEISVEYVSEGRVPPDVELAAFRIAQEAIANAVRHGSPPIVVRCRTSERSLSMSIEDAGTGEVVASTQIPEGDTRGRFGLITMRQRADTVGARLEWRRGDEGGTAIALEWRAASAPA